jgi:hypothetical protein
VNFEAVHRPEGSPMRCAWLAALATNLMLRMRPLALAISAAPPATSAFAKAAGA